MVINGGYNNILLRPEIKSTIIDVVNERVIDMAHFHEPKMRHRVVSCWSKVYVLGGYSSEEMEERSNTVYKYDIDFKKWKQC